MSSKILDNVFFDKNDNQIFIIFGNTILWKKWILKDSIINMNDLISFNQIDFYKLKEYLVNKIDIYKISKTSEFIKYWRLINLLNEGKLTNWIISNVNYFENKEIDKIQITLEEGKEMIINNHHINYLIRTINNVDDIDLDIIIEIFFYYNNIDLNVNEFLK